MKKIEFWHFGRPSIDGVEDVARRCEALGFDGLSMTDSQNLAPDTYMALTLAAQATSTLRLGPAVTNPLTRHAAVTASAIATLQAVSGGRAMLGMGRGDSSLFNIGHKPVAPRAFERYLADVQTYLRGDALDAAGYESRLHWLDPAVHGKVPVDVSATGPKVIALAARHAERVSFAVGSDPQRVQWAIDRARDALAEGQAQPSFGLYLNMCVHDDLERAAELVRPGVGIFAHFSGMPGAGRDQVPGNVSESDRKVFERMSDYDKARHGSGDAAHAQALPVDFIQRFAVIGPAARCIEKLTALRALGIERIFVLGPRPDHFGEEALAAQERLANEVIPEFR